MSKLSRIVSHMTTTRRRVHRAFPPKSMHAIEQAIKAAEVCHAGEIRFVVEGALDGVPLLKGQSAHERAIEVFSLLRIWDTEHNSGVLIYLLLADRRVEIVADRGIHARVGPGGWEALCRDMEAAFRSDQYEQGAITCIGAVAQHLSRHFPSHGQHAHNELPDAPVVL
ncbi:MAG: hypothetical protein EKK47_16085 [Burkholderiales bacterium]|nr:MAG: hypothetical protein EKK47_16085 [Burkholderiales bacterium]